MTADLAFWQLHFLAWHLSDLEWGLFWQIRSCYVRQSRPMQTASCLACFRACCCMAAVLAMLDAAQRGILAQGAA